MRNDGRHGERDARRRESGYYAEVLEGGWNRDGWDVGSVAGEEWGDKRRRKMMRLGNATRGDATRFSIKPIPDRA